MASRLLLLLGLVFQSSAVQIMIKNNEWHCFEVPADMKTTLDVDYLVTGMDPENTKFEARQSGEVLESKDNARSAFLTIRSNSPSDNIELCFQKTDRKSKKLNLMFKRNQAHSEDAADLNTLDSLVDDLKLL